MKLITMKLNRVYFAATLVIYVMVMNVAVVFIRQIRPNLTDSNDSQWNQLAR